MFATFNSILELAARWNCYQFRVQVSGRSTPRCCYASRQNQWSWWWGWWSWGPLIEGEFGSRYERFQIPVVQRNPGWSWIFQRDPDTFDLQYNQSLGKSNVYIVTSCKNSWSCLNNYQFLKTYIAICFEQKISFHKKTELFLCQYPVFQ